MEWVRRVVKPRLRGEEVSEICDGLRGSFSDVVVHGLNGPVCVSNGETGAAPSVCADRVADPA